MEKVVLFACLVALSHAATVEFCPTIHADMLRRQASHFASSVPFNETNGKKHTPYITYDAQSKRATVKVGDGNPYHPMVASSNKDDVHFVTHIYVLDQNGSFIAMDLPDPSTSSRAEMSFDVPSGVTKMIAYEWCNKHGLWEGPALDVTAGTQSGQCAKDTIETGAWASYVADFHRRQALEFGLDQPKNETSGQKHTPYLTQSGERITVKVGVPGTFHPMTASTNPSAVHWVTHVWVVDQTGKIVVMNNLDPTHTTKAEFFFTVPSGATKLTAYEFCNIHGLWVGPELTVFQPEADANVSPRIGMAGLLLILVAWAL